MTSTQPPQKIIVPEQGKVSAAPELVHDRREARSGDVRSFDPSQSAFSLAKDARVMTLSDLHFGVKGREFIAGRGRPYYDEEDLSVMIEQAMEAADHLVLNGDIFEMVYTQRPDAQALVQGHHAPLIDRWMAKLDALHADGNGCTLHLVLGNHDDDPALYEMLEQKAAHYGDQFRLHPVALRLGDALFTHGDLPLRKEHYGDMDVAARVLGREEFLSNQVARHWPQKPLSIARDLAAQANAKVHFMVQRAVELWAKPSYALDTLYESLKDSPLMGEMRSADGVWLPPARQVVTGHTHAPYVDQLAREGMQLMRDVAFHNTGSPVEVKRFCPIELVAGDAQETVVDVLDKSVILSEAALEKDAKVRAEPVRGAWVG